MISPSSIGLSASNPVRPIAGVARSLGLNPFSRDRTLFDSGVAVGRNAADVPLRGHGQPGATIQARAVSVDDGGASSTAWADIATVGQDGTWAGVINVPRASSWFLPEIRLASDPSNVVRGTMRFGVGHVIAIWGQSEPDRILSTVHDGTTPPTIADGEAVQIFSGAAGNPKRDFVSNANPVTAAAAALAQTLVAARPGEKFALVFHTVPGTDPRSLVDDGDPSRAWANDRALHDVVTSDGSHVGIAAMSWFAAPGNLGASYAEALFPLFSGKTIDGTAVSFPATIQTGAGTYHADHWFGELYDYAHTRWVAYGPHRFDIDTDMQDATHYVGGGLHVNLANKQAARASWRAMLSLPDATMFLPLGLEPLTYVNGRDDGAGGWTDLAHPAGDTPDGTQAFARLTALAILQSAGLVGWPVPEFDNCLWEPSGAWVEFWCSAGPVTTTRRKRGEPALGTTHPHWTEVMGFQINGRPARRAEIVAGRVRVYPDSGSFTHADTVTFGEGGATGMIAYPDDMIAETWKNLPIVDVGAPGLDGIPVRPLPDPAVTANTLPVTAPSFATSASGPYFLDPQPVPAGTVAITHAARIRLDALPATSAILFAQAATGFDVELMNTGNLRITLEDGTGLRLISSAVVSAALVPGVWYDIVVSADHGAQVCRVMVDGALIATLPFSATGDGQFQSNRALSWLARNSGALQFVGRVEYLKTWLSATADGSAPASTPYKVITGPATAANSDPWKMDADAS
ncbi:concanavalin A-like lectin/glucanase superfamily protein [Albidovulum inexpectatum]|uniref:Concanavalin A-like lectin/glucanase superfamily protein n=1 Tax=Albidovulum inexpectatum TaxID=196587 RepID=A0A2S5JDT8_9RHOB|nr:LamG-like jellyroll fold domain-containing protein [Albidovulum inexpectatum]PPB79666.1 concanavalin A-like lectin/glucanase superfamily protein [Albidovulum inexpectatum]